MSEVPKLLREMRQVLTDLKDQEQECLQNISGAIDLLPDRASLARLSIEFMKLGNLRAVDGAVEVLDGNERGWSDLGEATYWKLWRLASQQKLFEDGGGRGRPANPRDLALCFLHGVTLGLRHQVSWCLSCLKNRFSDGEFAGVGTYPLAAFALTLGDQLGDGELVNTARAGLGIYAEAVACLKSGSGFEAAIRRMVDYHLDRTIDRKDSILLTEFEEYPYPVFPVEITAFRRVCESRGLAVQVPHHDLLTTPLNYPVLGVPSLSDIAMRVAATIERALPDLRVRGSSGAP